MRESEKNETITINDLTSLFCTFYLSKRWWKSAILTENPIFDVTSSVILSSALWYWSNEQTCTRPKVFAISYLLFRPAVIWRMFLEKKNSAGILYMYLLSFRILQELPKNMESWICEWEPAKRAKTAILVGKNWLTALAILDILIWNYPYFTSAIFVRLLMSYNVFVKHVEEVF